MVELFGLPAHDGRLRRDDHRIERQAAADGVDGPVAQHVVQVVAAQALAVQEQDGRQRRRTGIRTRWQIKQEIIAVRHRIAIGPQHLRPDRQEGGQQRQQQDRTAESHHL